MSQSNLQTEVASATADKWPVKVHAAGRGQWGFVAGPRSGTGYQSKQAALEAGEAARLAAIARASARTSDQARARWAAEYREARKVRGFERALLPNAGLSSLYGTVQHDAYIAALHSEQGVMMFARRNGRYGIGGRTKRFIVGPARRLPA